ncbi:unnamed protein product [Mytilus coruscus]|uniref:Novel STAND NTPase 3 domain-containing protein n=1 Tax=Mytilus coruscus TaxID=42192 RepID=A0A6J8E5V6_MYTCO|nr:unnamed protein product [Mytilus coruscus]
MIASNEPTLILLLTLFSLSNAIQCPDSSQWNFRQSGICNKTHQSYFCLYDENLRQYVEFCGHKPDIQRPGYKFIVRGNLDGSQCNETRYQPTKFWTNGSSECIYKKSNCSEEGLIIHAKGNSTSDTTCRCDYTKGYAFVNRPKGECFCDPTVEDCSCYRKPCNKSHVLTPDYSCIRTADWTGIFNCVTIKKQNKFVLSDRIEMESTDLKETCKDLPLPKENMYEPDKTIFTALIIFTLIFSSIAMCTIVYRKKIYGFYSNVKTIDARVEKLQEMQKSLLSTKTERQDDFNENIPKKVRDAYETYITDWNKDDQKFYVTKGANRIDEILCTHNCVLVVGRLGNGKSAIIRHIALKLFYKDGYDIVPIVLDPTTILQYHKPERKQVFVIDDFCGKGVINAQNVKLWSLYIDEVLKLINNNQEPTTLGNGTVKLLFATVPSVFKDLLFKRFNCLSNYTFDLAQMPLEDKDKIEMIQKYFKQEQNLMSDDLKITLQNQSDIFPLLCKLSEGKTVDQIIQLFSNPYVIIKTDFHALQETNKKQMCLIALCVLLEKLQVDFFLNENKHEKSVLKSVCSEVDLDLDKESTRSKLQVELKHLEKTYLTKSSDSYHLVHKIVFDIAAVVCGDIFKNSFLRFAPYSFIAERYSFTKREEKENRISISKDTEKKYFDRLMNDLEQMITYSTFHNRQLSDDSYRKAFCVYCRNRRQKVIELLNRLQQRALESSVNPNDKTTATSDENVIVYEDYIEYTKSYHFSSHNMKKPLIESVWEGYKDIVELLVELEHDVNENDRFGRSALFVACHLGKEDVAEKLLEMNADHSLCDNNETSPLLAACKGGHAQIVKSLLRRGANTSKSDKNGCTPLLAASESGETSIVENLLAATENEKTFQCDNLGRSALFVASCKGQKQVVELLIKNNANINECNRKGVSPLMAACSEGKLDVVNVLIQHLQSKDILMFDNDGRSALFMACKKGYDEIVDILLKEKADALKCDWHQRSPLFIASALGHENVVSLLVTNKDSFMLLDEDGKSPLYIACEKGRDGIVEIILDTCPPGVIEKSDKKRRSPLYAACKGGYLPILEKLISKDAKVNTCNIWNETPLFAASREGHCEVVKYLINKQADVTLADSNGYTPLSVACYEGNAEIVKILVEKGSDVNHRDKDKRTPMEIAHTRGHVNIEDIFKEGCK